jgi:hypothetical protein
MASSFIHIKKPAEAPADIDEVWLHMAWYIIFILASFSFASQWGRWLLFSVMWALRQVLSRLGVTGIRQTESDMSGAI